MATECVLAMRSQMARLSSQYRYLTPSLLCRTRHTSYVDKTGFNTTFSESSRPNYKWWRIQKFQMSQLNIGHSINAQRPVTHPCFTMSNRQLHTSSILGIDQRIDKFINSCYDEYHKQEKPTEDIINNIGLSAKKFVKENQEYMKEFDRYRFMVSKEEGKQEFTVMRNLTLQHWATYDDVNRILPEKSEEHSKVMDIVKRLEKGNPGFFPTIDMSYTVIDTSDTIDGKIINNAFGDGLGNLYISKSLVNDYPDTITAFLLCHEIAHVIYCHAMEIFSHSLFWRYFASHYFNIMRKSKEYNEAEMFLKLKDTLPTKHDLPLWELEADTGGFKLLTGACYHPNTFINELKWVLANPKRIPTGELSVMGDYEPSDEDLLEERSLRKKFDTEDQKVFNKIRNRLARQNFPSYAERAANIIKDSKYRLKEYRKNCKHMYDYDQGEEITAVQESKHDEVDDLKVEEIKIK